MPKSMTEKTPYSIKQKYHEKTLSDSAISITFIRLLDIEPLFADFVWLQIPIFDLSQLGLGLLYNILPIEYEPFSINFTFEMPTITETLQGAWINFQPIDFSELYTWTTNFKDHVTVNVKDEFQSDLLIGALKKAVYGETQYERGYYDPLVTRELLRATCHRLRLLRTPDISWRSTMKSVADQLEMTETTSDHIYNRVMMLYSAQTQSFVLGLSLLGLSRLSTMKGEYAEIPLIDAQGYERNVLFRTLDHLQIGFILGLTPLGYGLLLPKTSVYKLPEGKKNPPIIQVMIEKAYSLLNKVTLTSLAYSKYNKPEEMVNYHKSDRADQYDLLQQLRRHVEKWVETQIPPEESNTVSIRQYQNAVLQAISWRAKRHKWGFTTWKTMTENDFKEWWLKNWSAQGLSITVLNNLYGRMSVWIERAREMKLNLGEKVKQARLRLALST